MPKHFKKWTGHVKFTNALIFFSRKIALEFSAKFF